MTDSKPQLFTSKQLRVLIFPLIAECFLSCSLGIADTMMISSIGEAAMSGVALVDMLNVLIINFFGGLATGGAVIAAQFIGKKNSRRASDCATEIIMLSLFVGVLIGGVMLLLRRQVMGLFFGSIEADVMAAGVRYLSYSACSYPFIAIYSASSALFRAMGNSKISMFSSLMMNIMNIFGNATLIFGFGLGIDGAAIATMISRFAAMLFLLIRISMKSETIHANFRHYRPNPGIIKKILYIGIPSSFENSIFQLGRVVVVSIISLFGTTQIAANSVAGNLDGFGCIPGQALQLAMITVIGQCIGAGDDKQTMYYARKLMKIAMIAGAAINAAVKISMPLVLKLYTLSDEARELTIILVIINCISASILWPAAFVLPNALKAAGDVKFTMVVSIVSMITLRVMFSYVLGVIFGLGAIGVWISMVLDWVLRASCFIARFRSRKWLHGSMV